MYVNIYTLRIILIIKRTISMLFKQLFLSYLNFSEDHVEI